MSFTGFGFVFLNQMMMNGKLIGTGVFVLFFLFSGLVKGQQFIQKTFAGDNTNFPNPERGMYHHKEVRSSAYAPLAKSELQGFRNDGITLVMRVFYLEDFVTGDISAQYLNNVQQDFTTAREAGVKLIVRFAYTQKSTPPYGDATPARVLSHIEQLSGLLRANSDVIALVQAGFIGAWGEWFYTGYFSQSLGTINAQNWADRKAVVDALLAAVSENRTVALRTPVYKRKITGANDPLTSEEAYSGSEKSRLGHHNDCFVASSNDVGTYVNVAEEKTYIAQETNYVPLGGETCGVSVPISECPNALAEVERLHWSYMNIDYHPTVIGGFNTNGCLTDIRMKLGYRYRLTKAHLQQEGRAGGIFNIDVALLNDGWANPYNPRTVEVVLKNKNAGGKEYFIKTTEDPRRWSLTDTIKFNVTVGLPADLEIGGYDLYLNLPDPEISLYGNSAYSIHLANENTWNDQTGYNDLGEDLAVTGTTAFPLYAGATYFLPRNQLNPSLTTSPLLVSSAANEVLVYWGLGTNDPYRVIERSDNGAEFHQVDVVPGNQVYYRDKNVAASTAYKYRYYFRQANTISNYTAEREISTSATNPDYYDFQLDGNADEWKTVAPMATRFTDGDTYAFRLFADHDSLNVLLEGQTYPSYALFLDTDNLKTTGVQQGSWLDNGFDFLLRNDSLYKASGASWSFLTKIQSKKTGAFRESGIPLSVLNIGDQNLIINAAAIFHSGSTDVLLPFTGNKPARYVRLLPAVLPSSFTVSNSEAIPESRLVVEWSDCSNCKGYVIERSPNGTDGFLQVFKTASAKVYRDENLTLNTSYFYRLYSFNESGRSGYTAVAEGKTKKADVVTGIEKSEAGITVYPNPVNDKLTIKHEAPCQNNLQVKLYNTVGNAVGDASVDRKSESESVVDLSKLPSGIYIIRIVEGSHRHTFKIVKL